MKKLETVNMFGVDVAATTMNQTVQYIEKSIEENRKIQHVVINAGKVVLMKNDAKLTEIISKCELINADGQSIVWGAKFLGKKLPERVAGIDLMFELLQIAEKKGYGVYFFGATEEVVLKTIENLKEKYPKLVVSGYRNGYFNEDENEQIVNNMNKSNAKILLVAFSSPKKEYWLSNNMKNLNIPFCMGVGGSFDVVAGKTARAPKWMQKSGLEWFYRFIQEPKRMWKRYIIGNLTYLKILLKERIV